jgi:hypothetical protein
MKRRHFRIIDHLLKFNFWGATVTEIDKEEYLRYQSVGGKEPKNNPLVDCQKWKEFTLANMIEEAFEWWIDNAGWIYPFFHSLISDGSEIYYNDKGKRIINYEKSKDPIMTKAMIKIIEGIEEKGMLDFYLSHTATKIDDVKLNKMLNKKYGYIN